MDLIAEIREHFATKQIGIRKITAFSDTDPAWTIRDSNGYGVMIINLNEVDIKERFANSKIESRKLLLDGREHNFLVLICSIDSLRYEFAAICTQFVELGEGRFNRQKIQNNPLSWWEQWKTIMGNTISVRTSYNIVAELLTLEYLLKLGKNVEWTGPDNNVHDIESDNESYEVKSTIKKYSTTVTISSQFQLKHNKSLYLFFCRLEKSLLGISINDMIERFNSLGYNIDKLERKLSNIGFDNGISARNEKYKILEKRKYAVNEDFPRITMESFKNNKVPDSIIQITYTVDLDGIQYSTW